MRGTGRSGIECDRIVSTSMKLGNDQAAIPLNIGSDSPCFGSMTESFPSTRSLLVAVLMNALHLPKTILLLE